MTSRLTCVERGEADGWARRKAAALSLERSSAPTLRQPLICTALIRKSKRAWKYAKHLIRWVAKGSLAYSLFTYATAAMLSE